METDVLRLEERVRLAIELGESHFREFKSAWEGPPATKTHRSVKDIAQDIGKTMVGFANADGGELLVGVEDDGLVTGIDLSDEKLQILLAAPRANVHKDTPLPPTRSLRLLVDGKQILYFSVPKGTTCVYLTADGRCLQRRDRESAPMATEAITFSRSETLSREYDRGFVENANIVDLDLQLVGYLAEHLSKGMSVEKCLQELDLAEFDGNRLRLRRAAVLLFARDPLRWHPRLQVRLLKVDGTEIGTGDKYNVTKDEEVHDNILHLTESSWDLLRPHLAETRFSTEALFKTQIIYPELACREALINAIAHRDYSNEGRGIEVRVYADRMEIVSPGELLSSISLEHLKQRKGVHESRNTLVTRVLRELGYMRELGEGIRRMYELMQSNDLSAPELRSGNNLFSVTLSHKFIYTEQERIWLESFQSLDLTRDQRSVVRLGYGGALISPKAIWDTCGIVDTDYYRRLLESLREKNVLIRKVTSKAAINEAARRHVSKKTVPQFAILPPGSVKDGQERRIKGREAAKEQIGDTGDYAQVYVSNLVFEVQEAELEESLRVFGDISHVEMPKHPGTPNNRGYAFVEFESLASADAAVAKSGQFRLRDRPMRIEPARPASARRSRDEQRGPDGSVRAPDARKLFLANLPSKLKQEALLEALSRYGKVLELHVTDPSTGEPRNYGFVTFAQQESARAALEQSGRIVLGGRVLYLQEYSQRPHTGH